MEYRGYDSAGVAVDGDAEEGSLELGGKAAVNLVKTVGKVKVLEDAIIKRFGDLTVVEHSGDTSGVKDGEVFDNHCGIAHTRWATHGAPCEKNSHPHRSNSGNGGSGGEIQGETNPVFADFVIVHNGIITNYKDLQKFLLQKGYTFESETDTEIIAKLIQHMYEKHPHLTFRELVEQVIQQLEGAFALAFKSRLFPGECVATR